jgi:glycine/D-amino acid oxidase-like deaminating enzyme
VVIVGGGILGWTAALHLAWAGSAGCLAEEFALGVKEAPPACAWLNLSSPRQFPELLHEDRPDQLVRAVALSAQPTANLVDRRTLPRSREFERSF